MKIEEKFIEWLKPEGVKHLKNIKKTYGTLLAVFTLDGIPHPVHFREGMQIRNWMRQQEEFKDKDCEWLDNNWRDFVEKCLKI